MGFTRYPIPTAIMIDMNGGYWAVEAAHHLRETMGSQKKAIREFIETRSHMYEVIEWERYHDENDNVVVVALVKRRQEMAAAA